ncbi:MAG TPA: PDZ domain-containing protein, partial [Firmicutes bacterium]|nr:PDZ domain-containing protein [Bacillota bacterium]
LTQFKGEDRNPVLDNTGEMVYYLTEQFGDFNVASFPLDDPGKITQITFHDRHPVRFLTISSDNTLCYGYHGDIYLYKWGESRKVDVEIINEPKHYAVDRIVHTEGVTEFDVSRDESEVVFVVRGDVFVTSAKYKKTIRITDTPEQERSVGFSPDGRAVVYASERNGSWDIYMTRMIDNKEKSFAYATALEEVPLATGPKEEFQPLFSPDGKKIAYLEDRQTLKVMDIESKKSTTILEKEYNYSYIDGDIFFSWSPDGRWLIFDMLNDGKNTNDIGMRDAKGKGPIFNLTNSGYYNWGASWEMKGQAIIYNTGKYGTRRFGGWFEEYNVYALFLSREAYLKATLNSEEYQEYIRLQKEEEKEKDKGGKDDKEDTNIGKIDIDWDHLEKRSLKLTRFPAKLSGAFLSEDGDTLYYLSRHTDKTELWKVNLRKNEYSQIATFPQNTRLYSVNDKRDTIWLLAKGAILSYNVMTREKHSVAFKAEQLLKPKKERAYFFEHIWRQVKEKFYDPDMNGVDWEMYKREYEPFLPSINNDFDFAELASEMLGELNASHTGAYARLSSKEKDNVAALGIFFGFDDENVDGILIKEVIPNGAFFKSGAHIPPGTVIKKIDGKPVKSLRDYFAALNHKEGTFVKVTVNRPGIFSGDEDLFIKGENSDYWNLYDRWVEKNRRTVELLSNGRLGYVHVPSMNTKSYNLVYHDMFGRYADAEGIIVDTRFNGGGNLTQELVMLLNGKKYIHWTPRGQDYGYDTSRYWFKKSIVIMSEGNYSDAHGFPYAYRTFGLGKLVGMPVPGTMTSVWWERLQNPAINFGIPEIGGRDLKGNYLENQQLEPDIKVDTDYELISQGRDQQLEAAVNELMKEIRNGE